MYRIALKWWEIRYKQQTQDTTKKKDATQIRIWNGGATLILQRLYVQSSISFKRFGFASIWGSKLPEQQEEQHPFFLNFTKNQPTIYCFNQWLMNRASLHSTAGLRWPWRRCWPNSSQQEVSWWTHFQPNFRLRFRRCHSPFLHSDAFYFVFTLLPFIFLAITLLPFCPFPLFHVPLGSSFSLFSLLLANLPLSGSFD